ncbi:hypothetical protein WG66_007921 [Moniliophthora roreri]|nr:hypothetical protein WG66_007921 [Moniliophthora roreri]
MKTGSDTMELLCLYCRPQSQQLVSLITGAYTSKFAMGLQEPVQEALGMRAGGIMIPINELKQGVPTAHQLNVGRKSVL